MKNVIFIRYILVSILLFLETILCSQNIATGLSHTLFLCADGTVKSLGNNTFGQLGDSTLQDSYTAKTVQQLNNVIAVSAGFYHSLALKQDGTVWAWGHNDWGELGDGTLIDRLIPVQVLNLSNIVAIDTYGEHSLALKEDGTVWGWGNNGWSQLIDSTGNYKITIPFQIPNINNVAFVCAGIMDSYVIKIDGTVWGWGFNDDNFTGPSSPQHLPVQIPYFLNAKAISVGSHHILVLKSDSTVLGWGLNGHGQLGVGTISWETMPVPMNGLNKIVKIATGNINSLALKNDGSVWACGTNWQGQLGVSTHTSYVNPFQIPNVSGITEISSHTYHSLARKSDGATIGWGLNDYGQLGSSSILDTLLPILIQSSCYTTYSNETKINDADSFAYYPNPTSDKITGYFKLISSGTISIQIFNSLGQVILEEHTINSQIELDLTRFENGIYFIKTSSNAGTIIEKIIMKK